MVKCFQKVSSTHMPTSSGRGLHDSISLPILGATRLFTFRLSCEYIIVSCCNLWFFDDGWVWASFPMLIHYLYFSVYGMPVHIFFLPSFQSFVILYSIHNNIFWMPLNTLLVLLTNLCYLLQLPAASLWVCLLTPLMVF